MGLAALSCHGRKAYLSGKPMCMDRQAMHTVFDVEPWVHHHDEVDLTMEHPTFFKVVIRILVLTDFFAQVPDGSLHCPLCVTGKRTSTDGLGGNMHEQVYAMMNKMNPRCFMLVVKRLKIPDKILEDCIAILDVLRSNNGTLEYLNSSNQFAVVFSVGMRKDVSQ